MAISGDKDIRPPLLLIIAPCIANCCGTRTSDLPLLLITPLYSPLHAGVHREGLGFASGDAPCSQQTRLVRKNRTATELEVMKPFKHVLELCLFLWEKRLGTCTAAGSLGVMPRWATMFRSRLSISPVHPTHASLSPSKYKSLRAFSTSPPRNRFTFLRSYPTHAQLTIPIQHCPPPSLVYGVWCLVLGDWRLAFGVWC